MKQKFLFLQFVYSSSCIYLCSFCILFAVSCKSFSPFSKTELKTLEQEYGIQAGSLWKSPNVDKHCALIVSSESVPFAKLVYGKNGGFLSYLRSHNLTSYVYTPKKDASPSLLTEDLNSITRRMKSDCSFLYLGGLRDSSNLIVSFLNQSGFRSLKVFFLGEGFDYEYKKFQVFMPGYTPIPLTLRNDKTPIPNTVQFDTLFITGKLDSVAPEESVVPYVMRYRIANRSKTIYQEISSVAGFFDANDSDLYMHEDAKEVWNVVVSFLKD